MAFYHHLKGYRKGGPEYGQTGEEKAAWIANGLLRLRKDIRESDLGKRHADNLVIGSWNIRALDIDRRDESFHYIAEIIDHFDICAIQEVKTDLEPLERIRKLLGPNWEYFVTDVTGGGLGNNERQAFMYNKNKVFFRRQVGEVVLAPDELIDGERQFARTPFLASFQAGWFRFTMMSVHIVFAGSSLDDKKKRAKEVGALAAIAAKRAKRDDQVYMMIGDMNIESTTDKIFGELTRYGLKAPLFGGTNLKGNKAYDQIALTDAPKGTPKTEIIRSGAVDWRSAVYRPEDKDFYESIAAAMRAAEGKGPYSNWDRSYEQHFMSFEMSDHLPIWMEIKTDYSDDYLRRFVPVE